MLQFPEKAIYSRKRARVYDWDDFADGEKLTFVRNCDDEELLAEGFAWYRSDLIDTIRLVNLIDMKQ